MAKVLSEKAMAFLAKNPTLIGRVMGYAFYEHPVYGDESTLIMITPEGTVKKSPFMEIPDALELADEVSRIVFTVG